MSAASRADLPGVGSGVAVPADPRRWWILAFVAIAQFLVVLDATVVNVMIPTISTTLGGSIEQLQWVVNGYVVVFGGFLLLGGRMADLLGRRRVLLAGIAVFIAGSVLAGLSDGIGMLVAARVLQGLGAAALSPAALSIVVTTFPDPGERTRALGIWGAIMGLGGALGALVGGALIGVHWSLAFFINVPLCLLVVAGVIWLVPASTRTARGPSDLLGAALGTAGVSTFVFGVSRIELVGWLHWQSLGLMGAGAALVICFLRVEWSRPHALLPRAVFTRRSVRVGVAAQVVSAATMLPFFFLLPQYLQLVQGYTPLRTGVAYLPTGVVMIVVSSVLPTLLARLGSRPVYVGGALITAAAAGAILLFEPGSSYPALVMPVMMAMGAGLVLCMMIGPIVGTAGASEGEAGAVSAVLNASSEVGGAVGLAVVVSVTVQAVAGGAASPTTGLHAGAIALVVIAAVNMLVGATMRAASRPGAEVTPTPVDVPAGARS